MLHRRWLTVLVVGAGLGLGAVPSQAQDSDRAQMIKNRLERMRERFDRIPARHRERFSGALVNLETRAHNADATAGAFHPVRRFRGIKPGDRVGDSAFDRVDREIGFFPAGVLAGGRVSDPKYDTVITPMGGFTQSETSTAWCSPNVVVTFNDSGSYLESYFFGIGGFSFNGYSRSTNNGTSFVDQGFLNPSANPAFFLAGDPVVRCTNENTFQYASLLLDYGPYESAISLSTSTDGGTTFANPVKAASKSLANHFLDKEWMTVDPANPSNIYTTYTDFDSSGTICGTTTGGSPIFRVAIEYVRSTDGGGTWSSPVELTTPAQSCDPNGNQGSFVEVGPAGEVYVAWLHFPATNPNNVILLRKSTDSGATFSPAVTVASVPPMGAFDGSRFTLQGRVRFNQFPHMAVDRSPGPRAGHIYVTWADGRYLSKPDVFSSTRFYNFGDVFVSRSTDGGSTWSLTTPRVNNSLEPPGSDQFFPGVAVDRTGAIQICFYDNRRDVGNFLWDRECARSVNGGATWINVRKTALSYPGLRNQDVFINDRYQGDYDDLASDTRELVVGFRGGFSDHSLGNQDVKLNK